MIIFKEGSMSVAEASKIFKKDPSWIRTGISDGWLPIGIAVNEGKRTNYYISPKKVYEFTGYLWKGEEV